MKERKDKTGLKVGDKLLIQGYRYAEVMYAAKYSDSVDVRVFGLAHNDPLSFYGNNWVKIKTIVTE
jgi:hypothetical protein